MNPSRTLLVCDDGTVFTGERFGAEGQAVGELIATTAMTGYQELLTSGAYEGSILLFTAPHIGNTGMNDTDGISPIRARGVILRESPRLASNWRSQRSMADDFLAAGVVGIAGIDTRALMRHLRAAGPLKAGIFAETTRPTAELVAHVREFTDTADARISRIATAADARPSGGVAVGVIDFGLGKELASTLARKGTNAAVFPATVSAEQVLNSGVERVLLSGGPGNPADATIGLGLARDLLAGEIPILGLGLGHQILARALGFATRALPHPHHGANHPVQNTATGNIDITSHSHSYTVDFADSPDVEITHVSLNDGTVEGFTLRGKPVHGRQFHPGQGAGPTDAHYMLDSFLTKDA